MKVHITVDIEGIACVTHDDQIRMGNPEHEYARKWMTGEANAAVEGAFEAGASEVVVADSHGHMRNMIPEAFHEDALLVRGSPRSLLMVEGIDSSFDAAILVGAHSAAGSPLGVLSHSFVGSAVHSIRLNGVEVGEPVMNAAIVGHFGVPVAMVSGDDTVEAEVEATLPWAERVVVKWALSTMAAKNLTPRASQKRIKAATVRALGRLKEMRPLQLQRPICLEVVFMRALGATVASDIPSVEREGGRTLRYVGADMVDVMKVFRLMCNATLGPIAL